MSHDYANTKAFGRSATGQGATNSGQAETLSETAIRRTRVPADLAERIYSDAVKAFGEGHSAPSKDGGALWMSGCLNTITHTAHMTR